MSDPRHLLGRKAERLAAAFLKKRGYRILHENYRCKVGEIDLIAEKAQRLIFVEVKAGRATEGFSPLDHFTVGKQAKLLTLAKAYLAGLGTEKEAQIDLILVTQRDDEFQVDHLQDVIQDPGL